MAKMTEAEKVSALQQAVTQLNAEVLASKKREEDVAAAYRDLHARFEAWVKHGQIGRAHV